MILYHFTDFYNLENAGPDAILAHGLKANDPSGQYPIFAGKLRPCVWFTSEPEANWWERMPECRLTIELSTISKRLVSWPKWLGRVRIYEPETGLRSGLEIFEAAEGNGGIRIDLGREPTEAESRAWRHWYVYFGDVPRSAIRSVEYADPKRSAEAKASGQTRTVTLGELDAERQRK